MLVRNHENAICRPGGIGALNEFGLQGLELLEALREFGIEAKVKQAERRLCRYTPGRWNRLTGRCRRRPKRGRA